MKAQSENVVQGISNKMAKLTPSLCIFNNSSARRQGLSTILCHYCCRRV